MSSYRDMLLKNAPRSKRESEEVPAKADAAEGSARGRGKGRGRGSESQPAAAAAAKGSRRRRSSSPPAARSAPAASEWSTKQRSRAAVTAPPPPKESKKVQRKKLHHDYWARAAQHEDETESDSSDGEHHGAYDVAEVEAFQIGMDIGILLKEVHENTLRVLTLVDVEGIGGFGDNEMCFLAAALKQNRGLLTLQARFLPLTDRSLVPLCESLINHPTIRSLDLSGTRGSDPTGYALIKLVHRNTGILHVQLDQTSIREVQIAQIELATRFNAFMCPDPRAVNPYDYVLLADFVKAPGGGGGGGGVAGGLDDDSEEDSEDEGKPKKPFNIFGGFAKQRAEERRKALLEQLGIDKDAKPGSEGSMDAMRASVIGRSICGDYMHGSCRFGSRCIYFHPDRTSTAERRITAEKESRAAEREAAAAASELGSVVTAMSSRRSLAAARAGKFAFSAERIKAMHERLAGATSASPEEDLDRNESAAAPQTPCPVEPAPPPAEPSGRGSFLASYGPVVVVGVVCAVAVVTTILIRK